MEERTLNATYSDIDMSSPHSSAHSGMSSMYQLRVRFRIRVRGSSAGLGLVSPKEGILTVVQRKCV